MSLTNSGQTVPMASSAPSVDFAQPQIRICQHSTCREAGALQVLAAWQQQCPPHRGVVPTGCLGQCGKGPNLVVLPEAVWYHYVEVEQVATIAARHCTIAPHLPASASVPPQRDRPPLLAYLCLGLASAIAIATVVWAIMPFLS